MLKPALNNQELLSLMTLTRSARRAVVCAHLGPDGDALGSSLAWAAYLKRLGIKADVIMPNAFPDFLRWMPGASSVMFYDRSGADAARLIAEADVIFCLDFNSPKRLQAMGDSVVGSKAAVVIIDHHLAPEFPGARLVISRPKMCSTSELVFRIIQQLGGFDEMTRQDAANIYTGMMTDTGGFTYSSTNPEIYAIISLLLTKGIDKDKIYRNVFNNYTESRLRLTGYILYEKLKFYEHRRASLFTLTREEMKRFKFIRGDAEGLVNMPLQVRGMRLSISLREDTEKEVIRVSLRSVDDFPCNRMAEEFFNGGGHLNASGGELPFPMEEAVKTAEQAIEKYKELLNPPKTQPIFKENEKHS